MAKTLVKVYYLEALDQFDAQCKAASKPHLGDCYFDAYIDDFQICTQCTEEYIFHQSWQITNALALTVKQNVRAILSSDKA